MKRPQIKELKEYFKNADTVKCLSDKDVYYVNFENEIDNAWDAGIYLNDCKDLDGHVNQCMLWKKGQGYAEILTYKEKTFSITESQIKELCAPSFRDNQERLKEMFAEAFESEVKSLPKDYTGWCRCSGLGNEKWIGYFENGTFKYGISALGEWFFNDGKKHNFKIDSKRIEATEQEVFEALKNEAVKRGLVGNCYYDASNLCFEYQDCLFLGTGEYRFREIDNVFLYNDWQIFSKGKWAEIIPTITLSEAEQQLKKKIII